MLKIKRMAIVEIIISIKNHRKNKNSVEKLIRKRYE